MFSRVLPGARHATRGDTAKVNSTGVRDACRQSRAAPVMPIRESIPQIPACPWALTQGTVHPVRNGRTWISPIRQILCVLAAAVLSQAQNTARFEPLYREALERRQAEFGPDDLRTANARFDLASFLNQQDRPAEAEPLLRAAATTVERLENPAALSRIWVALSESRIARGDVSEAESLLQKALDTSAPPARADIADRLAALMRLKGDFDQAERFARQALTSQSTPDRLRALAVTLEANGGWGEAEDLHRKALALQESRLGPDHPDVALSLNSIALLMMDRGELEAAAPLLERALAIFERTLGPESAEAATALDNLGNVRRAQQKYPEAEPLLLRALAVRRITLGPDHPDTAATLNNLAGLYHVQGRLAEAEPLYREAITIRAKQLGEGDPETARTLYNLGHLLRQKGDSQAAADAFSQALNAAEKTLGPADPFTGEIRDSLAALQR